MADLVIDGLRLPARALLGGEGQAWEIIAYSLANERLGIPRYTLARAALDRAVSLLVERSAREGSPIGELCRKLFKDYPFGLQLIASNTGEKSFTLPRRAAEEPDRYLSDLVVASYRRPNQETGSPGS